MYNIRLLLAALLLFSCTQNNNAQKLSSMFLGNASHVPNRQHIQNDCFDQLSWKFNAGGAIRSTPVTDDKYIYVGTEKGEFYCIDQLTGKISWKFNTGYPI